MSKEFSIIEIGSNNTKTHVYKDNNVIYENVTTIEFKKNYEINNKILKEDLDKLYKIIETAKKYTKNVYVYGCSIFRKLTKEELDEINNNIEKEFGVKIEVVSQEEEALLTAYGCYNDIDYNGRICIFIGGGGSTELIFVENKKVIDHIFLDFGVVDVTNKYPALKEDYCTYSYEEVTSYVDSLIDDINYNCDLLILAGGDHLYWYNNARYELLENSLYKSENQKYMIPTELSDKYDRDMLVTSLNEIKQRSDNPLWFDGSRAMKVITNLISHRIKAKYIIPTKINMENGLANKIMNEEN